MGTPHIALPVRFNSHDDGETVRQAAERSVDEVDTWLRSGGLRIHLSGRGDGLTGLHGFDVENVLTLARLFLAEHPDWPEPLPDMVGGVNLPDSLLDQIVGP